MVQQKKSLYPIQTGIWTVEIGIEPSKIVIEPEKNQRQEIKKSCLGQHRMGPMKYPLVNGNSLRTGKSPFLMGKSTISTHFQ